MFRLTDPQRPMFGAASTLPEATRARLAKTWAGPFHDKILPLLLKDESRFAQLYCEDNGRPNWSIARRLGICLLQELLDATDQEVLDAVTFDARFQHALDLAPADAYLSRRSLCDFRSRLVRADPEMKLARHLFDDVAGAAIKDLALSFQTQRMDSTQIMSNIRTRGRVDLFTKTLRQFVRDLSHSAPGRYAELSDEIRAWFEASVDTGDFGRSSVAQTLQQLAEWAVGLVAQFEPVEDICSWESWELVRRLVNEHCVIVRSGGGDTGGEHMPDDRVIVNVKAQPDNAGSSLQSPYDPDATYGHKGVGYSVQIAETVGNAVGEILTDFEVRPAASNDWGQTTPALDRLEAVGRKPDTVMADAGFPHPTALLEAEERGVTLWAPVSSNGLPKDAVGRDRFVFAEDGTVLACPEGHAPIRHACRKHANQQDKTLHAYFDGGKCRACPLRGACVARGGRTGSFRVEIRRELRLRDEALAKQRNDPTWWETYRARAGIEATNSELKRGHGLGRLRVRRRPRVVLAVTLKLTACNAKRWLKAAAANA